jgi:hypothetical protein
MRQVILRGCKGKSYISGAQWLKPQANLKPVMVSRAMNSSVVVVFHIRKVVIPRAWVFVVVHPEDVHDHPINDLCLAIDLGMEGSGFGEPCVSNSAYKLDQNVLRNLLSRS